MAKKEQPDPNRIQAEILAAKESKRLLERDKDKYWRRIFGLYISGLMYSLAEKKLSNLGILTRETYLFFRHIDDVLDGDIEMEGSPLAYVRNIQSDIKHPHPNMLDPAKMARYSLKILEPLAREGESPEQLFIDAIDAMIFDYKRKQKREVLTEQEIDQYYINTFQPVLNLMFIGLKSDLRVTNDSLSDLAICQGRIYSLRDLENDWENGIINIPKETLEKTGLSSDDEYKDIIFHSVTKNWIAVEIYQQRKRVEMLREEIVNSGEDFTLKALDFALIKHMLKTLDKLEIEHY